MGADFKSSKLRKFMRALQSKLTIMIYDEQNISPPNVNGLYKKGPPGWEDTEPYVKFQSICNMKKKEGGDEACKRIFKNLLILFRKTVKRIPKDLFDVLNCYKELTETKDPSKEREEECLQKIDVYMQKLDTEKTMEKIPNDKLDNVFLHILQKYTEKVEKEQNPPSDKILDSVYQFLDSVERIQKKQETHPKTVKRKSSSNNAAELPAKRKKPSRNPNKYSGKSQPSIHSNYNDHKGNGKGPERRKRNIRRKALYEDISDGIGKCSEKKNRNSKSLPKAIYEDITDDKGSVDSDLSKRPTSPRATGSDDSNLMGIGNGAEKRMRNSQFSQIAIYEDITDDEGSVDSDSSKRSTSSRATDLDISNIMFCSERGIHSSASYEREQAVNRNTERIPQKTVPYVSSDSDSDAENSHKRLSYTSTDVMFGQPRPDEPEEITYETTGSDNNSEEIEEENYTEHIFKTFPLSFDVD